MSNPRFWENTCEHGDHEAEQGKRFCSPECEACDLAPLPEGKDGCAGICDAVVSDSPLEQRP